MLRGFRLSGKAADFLLWHWTDDPDEAAACAAAGVDRIGIDLDRNGKAERQAGQQSWISPHQLAALPLLRARLPQHCLFLRTNPLHAGSRDEVEAALAAGADVLMLPNFQTLAEVEVFVGLVDGRAAVVPLVERRDALPLIAAFPALGITEIHFGLNDLALDFGVRNRLALLLHPEIEAACTVAGQVMHRFGVGGVASPNTVGLPVPAVSVIAQHGRLGSGGAMLARCFWGKDRAAGRGRVLPDIRAIRTAYAASALMTPDAARGLLEQALEAAK
jgi:hypothetical protein